MGNTSQVKGESNPFHINHKKQMLLLWQYEMVGLNTHIHKDALIKSNCHLLSSSSGDGDQTDSFPSIQWDA